MLQTIAVLEAQRTQAVQDLESLGRHQREALKDPIGFVERLQKKVLQWEFLSTHHERGSATSNSYAEKCVDVVELVEKVVSKAGWTQATRTS